MSPALAALTRGDFTLHTWFKTRDTGRGILMGDCCGSTPRALNFELHTRNRLRLWIAGPEATTDLNVSVADVGKTHDGEWHAATALRRGKSVELYFDGVKVGQAADVAGSFVQAPSRYYFGRDDRLGSTRFSGQLDAVTMWPRALTAEQITALANGASPVDRSLPPALLHYAFETTGGTAVSHGRSAVGRIDDTGGHNGGPYHGETARKTVLSNGEFGDGELSLELSSADDDVLGLAFRMQDPERYYLFAMDRQRGFRTLTCKDGDSYRLLDSSEKDYRPFRWYRVSVVLDGPKIAVFIDGEKELEATDTTFRTGTFALYTWGSEGARFRNVVWTPR